MCHRKRKEKRIIENNDDNGMCTKDLLGCFVLTRGLVGILNFPRS